MYIGTFRPLDSYKQFQLDVHEMMTTFKEAGVSQLLIDVTSNLGTHKWLRSNVLD